ncbi:unnamed protein product [Prorocentrum cordatum]|uniref:Exocyst complex component Sec6 n=1 Tax=Prorocentrum cordatum TaxID=2364126 RepID=A0ABN9RNR2_9DINO|nr:unnamed protein product [Polarella glacialis]
MVKHRYADELYSLCACCDTFYTEAMTWLPIPDLMTNIANDPEFKKDFHEGRQRKKNGGGKDDYQKESVGHISVHQHKVTRKALIMNRDELKQYFNYVPTKKSIKEKGLVMIELWSESDLEPEDAFLFQWSPTWAFLRSYSISMIVSTERRAMYMTEGTHLFSSQAARVFEWSMGEQQHTGALKLMSSLKPHEEYGFAVPPEILRQQQAYESNRTSSLSSPSCAPTSAMDLGDSPMEAGGGPSGPYDGDLESSAPPTTIRDVCTQRPQRRLHMGSSLSGTTLPLAGPSTSRTPGSVAGSGLGVMAPPATAAVVAADSASQCGGGADAKLGKGEFWAAKLPLLKVMTQGKLGVQAYHAREELKKLKTKDKDQWNKLSLHMVKYDHAHLLHTDQIFTANETEILDAYKSLSKSLAIPASVKSDLVKKTFDDRLASDVTDTDANMFFDLMWPWPQSGDAEKEFDPKQPKLHLVETEVSEKITVFTQKFLASVFNAYIEKGKAYSNGLKLLGNRMSKAMDDLLATETALTAEVTDFLEALGLMVSGVVNVCDPTSVWTTDDVDNYFATIASLDTSRGDFYSGLEGIAIAVGACEHYNKIWTMLTDNRVMVQELSEEVGDAMMALNAVVLDPMNFTGASTAVTTTLACIPKVSCSLDWEIARQIIDQTKSVLASMSNYATEALERGTFSQGDRAGFGQLLGKAVDIMPHDADLVEMKATLEEADATMARDAIKAQVRAMSEAILTDKMTCELLRKDLPLVLERVTPAELGDELIEVLGACSIEIVKTAADDEVGIDAAANQAAHGLHDFLPVEIVAPQRACLEAVGAMRSLEPAVQGVTAKIFDEEGFLQREQIDLGDPELTLIRFLSEKLFAFTREASDSNADLHAYVVDKVSTLREKAVAILRTVGAFAVETALADCQAAVAKIQPFLRGAPDGESWLNGVSDKDQGVWKRLSDHADGTIMSSAVGKAIGCMKKDLDSLAKALTLWKNEASKYGMPLNSEEGEYKDAVDQLQAGWLTVVTGSLFAAFKKAESKQSLRAICVKLMGQLKEQSVLPERLPPALVQRVNQAMQLKNQVQ